MFVLCAVAFAVGWFLCDREHSETQEYSDAIITARSEEALELRVLIREQGELIDTQATTIAEYADMGPEEHLRIAENMLNVERSIIPAEAFNQMLKPSRRTASRIMRMHMEPEDNANATDFS